MGGMCPSKRVITQRETQSCASHHIISVHLWPLPGPCTVLLGDHFNPDQCFLATRLACPLYQIPKGTEVES